MNRKEFIKSCGFVCLGALPMGLLMQGCAGAKSLQAKIHGDDMIVPLKDFEMMRKGQLTFRKYLVIYNEQLQYPICIYRFSANDYTALLMRCTHQGSELSVFGDKLVCAAHGSEFDNRGAVAGSPADKPLRSFPVTIHPSQLNISLKAV